MALGLAAGRQSATPPPGPSDRDTTSGPSDRDAIFGAASGILGAVLDQLSTRIFADGADLDGIIALAANPRISGFTTNPTLMWKAGLTDYAEFAQRLLEQITKHPISFEVFADDAEEMRRQARLIASWGENVYVKIPVTTTQGESMAPLVRELSEEGIQVNITALFTTAQVELITAAVKDGAPSYISVFAGRIADAGIDPVPIMARSVDIMVAAPRSELIWASPREILNLVQADQVGCHIITITHDLLKKLDCLGKSLEQYSLETVQMFHGDAVAAGFTL
jgi:transaldolase